MTTSVGRARAWVEVDLAALRANARTVAARSGARLLPMVKANGYGLGAVAVARALRSVDPWGFGVATVDEGAELRAGGIEEPIVVFTPLGADDLLRCAEDGLRPTIGDAAALAAWRTIGGPCHVEIDTGMARAGIRWDDRDALGHLAAALRDDGVCEGVFTHFHSAETDAAATAEQWRRFEHVLEGLPLRPALLHAANSAAALAGPAYAADLVRPGIFLYGGAAGHHRPRAVAALRARVVALRTVRAGQTVSYGALWRAPHDTVVATLSAGYADGVHRHLSNVGVVELGGHRAPILGRVTMDMTMVVAPAGTAVGDVATVWGGEGGLDAQAAAAGTISYELLTSLGRRLPRFHSESA